MKLRKQLLSLVLGGALIISALAGCSSDNKNDKFDSTQTPQNVEIINIQGSSKDFNTWIYLDPTTNIMYREAVFDSGLGGEPVNIAQLSDLHFNYINKQDREENNPSIMSTYSKRKWVRGGTSARKAANCLKAVADFDQIVMTTATAAMENTEKQGNKLIFTGNANVSVILTNGAGIYLSRNFMIPLRAETDAPRSAYENSVLSEAIVLNAGARLDGDHIQTNLEILISYTVLEKHSEARVRQISVYKDRPVQNEKSPSLTLCYPASKETLWDVAKKYSTTIPELMAANGLSAENIPSVLVIPRRQNTSARHRIL